MRYARLSRRQPPRRRRPPAPARALQQTMAALMDAPDFVDPHSKQTVFAYAHPIFWAPFTLVGDGGGD